MTAFVSIQGQTSYSEVHALQQKIIAARAANRVRDVILFVEHESTITVGRSRDAQMNVAEGADLPVVEVERGGDVTLHAPGQLVVYPLIALQGARRDLLQHLRALEQAVIDALASRGVPSQRDARNTGVWVTDGTQSPRKICSIGVACRRWVTWHGLALNLTNDLALFQQIRPCGFSPDVMTRVADWLPHPVERQDWETTLADTLSTQLQLPRTRLQPWPVSRLDELLASLEANHQDKG